MSRVVVSNINSPNGTVSANVPAAPVTMSTANTLAGAAIVDNNSVYFLANSSINCTMNTTSIYLNGIDIVQGSSGGTETVIFSGNVTPAALTSNASAWNPDSTDIAYTIRVSANNFSNTANTAYGQNYEPAIFGFSAGTNGQIYTIKNIGAQKIYFRTEDTVTETTAANRFNFPNHVVLDGGMSMELYYDGTLARWRMLDSINIPFEHKQALTKGFWGGGGAPPGPAVSTVDKITYSTETRQATFSNTLSQARSAVGAAGNADKGFFSGGGSNPGPLFFVTADRITYSDESCSAVSGANLSQARATLTAAGNADKGFFCGGLNPATLTTSDRTTYSTETTAAVSAANLSQARYYLMSAGNVDKGFFSGGWTPALVATADRITYSTETRAAVTGANLTSVRKGGGAAGNSDKGFFSGGIGPTGITNISTRTTYSTETTAAVSGTNLSQSRTESRAAGTQDKGFYAGGSTSPAAPYGYVATTDRTTYSTETLATVAAANLSGNKYEATAV